MPQITSYYRSEPIRHGCDCYDPQACECHDELDCHNCGATVLIDEALAVWASHYSPRKFLCKPCVAKIDAAEEAEDPFEEPEPIPEGETRQQAVKRIARAVVADIVAGNSALAGRS